MAVDVINIAFPSGETPIAERHLKVLFNSIIGSTYPADVGESCLLSMMILNLHQRFDTQKGARTPMPQLFFIKIVIVQGENSIHLSPISFIKDDTRSAFAAWIGIEETDDSKAFGFG
jgi:hypothetical protein